MRLRAVIFDDEPAICQGLGALCADRGYEVFTFPDPTRCPLYVMPPCPCPPGSVCADLLLVDLLMPEVDGLAFVEGLRAKGCPAPQIALMSGAWGPAARALRLGCRLFRKPFALADILAWFATVEAQVDPTRALLDWPGQGGRIEPPAPEDRLEPGFPPRWREGPTAEERVADPMGPFGPWLLRRVADAVKARELPGHLLERLRRDLADAESTGQAGGDLLSVQEIADLAGVGLAQAAETFAALQQVPGVARQRMRRRIAEAWLERQRRLCREGEPGG